ncbi:MAG: DNA alkylation repair protein [Verrucomicrobiaceae bacterium]|nr:DNA alkylation repair protein [Verrucomicrobiaceae bacterium]
MSFTQFRRHFRAQGSAARAMVALRFFKTGPGEYGEGDQFLGLTVPQVRAVLPQTDELTEAEVLELLRSNWHEERLLALLILVRRFDKAKKDEAVHAQIVKLYLANTKWINNWDLVDTSAPQILGAWLLRRDRAVLGKLAKSNSLWEQRIAVLATLAFIRTGDFADTLCLCGQFLTHEHDLMHKACGWMLREAGKRNVEALREFLNSHASHMPRTMLRYAIEKLLEPERRRWMARR